MEFVGQYARNGLRTLLLTVRDLDETTYADWNKEYTLIENTVTDREANLAIVNARIETNLVLIGSTAIEDKL
jgi:phospholipid-translocating ATPase